MPQRNKIIERLAEELDKERFDHSLRVEQTALKLAKRYGVAARQVSLAALLHDCARRYDRPGLLRQARKHGIVVDAVSRAEPKLLHAELSAILAKKEFGIRDKRVLNAIRRHTIGAPAMSRLEQVIYLADHLEEGRQFRGVNDLRRLVKKDLNKAMVGSTTNMLEFLLKQGLPIHPGTIATRNYYLMRS
ncbi:MAG: bis(5'-nucleosyl)-tetraphosphatase (symmetrical) YqeK [Candidatus Saganbacteria bacterium]|nr:bis(5'-nucleosyl)-tetraphosphatase (symmetrical) YqeK [Candidatus Saganbacteria bacterium]